MEKSKVIALLTVFAMLSTTVLTGCGPKGGNSEPANAGSAKQAKVSGALVDIATSNTAGVYYPLGNALGKLWRDKLGVKGTVQATNGTVHNINLFEKKEAEIAFVQNGVVAQAYKGEGQFVNRPQKDLRSMSYLYPNVVAFIVRKDSGVNSIKDLEGKKIVPGGAGTATELNTKEIIAEYGLDYTDKKNVKADLVGYSEAAELMKNKQADMAMVAGGIPTAAIMDMSASFDIKILQLEPEMIKKLTQKYPWYFEYTIPANTYKGQAEAIKTVAVANILIARKDLDEELVYQLTKTMYENTEELVASHNAAKDIKIKDALNGLTAPLHPGAERFYKEKGLDTSKVIKAN